MAITVMATVKSTNKIIPTSALICFLLTPALIWAGEWTFEPNIGLTETYTNNVELSPNSKQSSLVSQAFIGLNTDYKSKYFDFAFKGTETYAAFSHDSDINDDFQEAQVDSRLFIGDTGLQIIASSSIENISKNDTDNSLADLVSGDTIQQQRHNAGLEYNVFNTDFSITSSITYNITNTEDNIGEYEGYSFDLKTKNGRSARNVFWQVDAEFDQRENKDFNGKSYSIEAKVGAITSYRINPFIRAYDEDLTGNILGANSNNSTPSIGPGIRWLPTDHFFIDIAYNFVDENISNSDDYVSTSINWKPSARTFLSAGYSQRFYGDSYDFSFSHKNKRLTNRITYVESLEAFDRNTFIETDLGVFLCPSSDIEISSPADCFVTNTPNIPDSYTYTTFTSLTPVENNEFTLNKRLGWKSILALSRTTFTFDISTRDREPLSSGVVDSYLNISFDISRKFSPISTINFKTRYSENIYNKNNPDGAGQKDTYKVLTATYNRKLADSISSFISIQLLDRESTRVDRNYQEARASLNITKDF